MTTSWNVNSSYMQCEKQKIFRKKEFDIKADVKPTELS